MRKEILLTWAAYWSWREILPACPPRRRPGHPWGPSGGVGCPHSGSGAAATDWPDIPHGPTIQTAATFNKYLKKNIGNIVFNFDKLWINKNKNLISTQLSVFSARSSRYFWSFSPTPPSAENSVNNFSVVWNSSSERKGIVDLWKNIKYIYNANKLWFNLFLRIKINQQ